MIKLGLAAIHKIVGRGCHEILVYGFDTCGYKQVADGLSELGYRAMMMTGTQQDVFRKEDELYALNIVDEDNDDEFDQFFDEAEFFKSKGIHYLFENFNLTRQCKSGLITLFIENYEKTISNQSITPLIFCINLDDQVSNGKFNLDLKRVALSHTHTRGYTKQELYFCYKIYSEANSKLKKVIEETIKFVTLRILSKTDSNDEVAGIVENAELELVEPFWNSPKWLEELKGRVKTESPDIVANKKDPWREVLVRKFGKEILAPNSKMFLTKSLQEENNNNNNNNNRADENESSHQSKKTRFTQQMAGAPSVQSISFFQPQANQQSQGEEVIESNDDENSNEDSVEMNQPSSSQKRKLTNSNSRDISG